MHRTIATLALLLLGVLPSHAQAPALPAQLDDFDAYVEDVRNRFDVPGIAVAIVQDGRIVLERGYGVRDLDTRAPVTPLTLFAIASNTKAFTSASLAMLADEGKLDLDDRVIDHLPWFQMSDPYVTREMRLRDLLAHRSGLTLGAGDLLYWPATRYSNEDVARRLRYVPLGNGFRDRYAYDNILYGVAQLVIEKVSGQPYAQFLQTRFFDPLGMRDTRYNSDALKPGDEAATGYAIVEGRHVPAPRLAWSNVGGAGGLYSNVHDLARWMSAQLAGGEYTDAAGAARRLFSSKRHEQMWSMVTPMPVAAPAVPELAPARPAFLGYAQGWQVSDFRGHRIVWHTGGWPGMVSRVTLLPERNVGVVVLTNAERGGAFNAIALRVLDAYLDAPHIDWSAAYAAALAKSQSKADEDWRKHLAARTASRAALPLDRYAGTYRDPWYGDVHVTREGGNLRMQFGATPELRGRLEHWQNDSFIVRWESRWMNADAFVDFSLDHDGAVREIRMQPVSPLTDFSFDFQDLRLAPVKPESH